jgi:peptidyl-prolyl cis-trans isomerase D
MSVIQSIRDKYARWAVVAIALALTGFILTDYLSTRNRIFGGDSSTTLGTVNGKKIDYLEFEKRLKNMEEQAQAAGQQISEQDRHQNNEQLWNQEVELIIMNAEFEKLGLSVGKRELNDYLFGNNPPPDMKQRFSNEQGMYNAAAAQEFINQMKRSPNQSDRDGLNQYLAALEFSRMAEKYNSLFTNSVYIPKWMAEKANAEASLLGKISYTVYPYSKISDTTIKISDKEISDYLEKNKDRYKQEESRGIAYVVFDAAPKAEDSAATKKQVGDLKAEFEKTTDPAAFLARYGSTIEYFDGYNGKSQIQVPAKDSIFAMAKGAVYGPYADGGSFVLAKLIDTKTLPDSVKARHVLIQTYNPQSGQQMMDDSLAKKRIDSIETAIKTGARFDSLAIRLSDDKGSGARGGLLSNPQNPQTDYFTANQMVKEFNDFCFEGKTGESKVVKTVFGYHLIEILDQKNFQPAYKVAYFSKSVVASDETDRVALEEASKFASESRDLKSFDANVEKLKAKGIQKLISTNIRPNDISIQGISLFGNSRQLVRDIYKADKGDVLPQHRVGDKYIVAAVTEIFEEGTQPLSVARPLIEPLLRNRKKAEQIVQKLGKVTTLEAAAAAWQDSVQTADSIRWTSGPLGFEPQVIGAAFNSSSKGKVVTEPLRGTSGVYVIRVEEQTATSVATTVADVQNNLLQRTKQMHTFYVNPRNLLRQQAKIKDNRKNFY